MSIRNDWEVVLHKVVTALDAAEVDYHLDASSSLYFHGIDFDMDDMDITVKWGSIARARMLFDDFCPTELSGNYPPSFEFKVNGYVVHIMSYQSDTGLGEASDRVRVKVGRSFVWSKTVEYYERNMKPNHPLKELLNAYRHKANL